MFLFGVVDQLDDLGVLDPAVRVEDEGEQALFEDAGVERRTQVIDRLLLVHAVAVLRLPIRRDD